MEFLGEGLGFGGAVEVVAGVDREPAAAPPVGFVDGEAADGATIVDGNANEEVGVFEAVEFGEEARVGGAAGEDDGLGRERGGGLRGRHGACG